ncbi:nitrilase-related carbon-nitrogen hydrolase [Chloroflexota bacterium]
MQLAYQDIKVAAVQMAPERVRDTNNPRPVIERNLRHMLEMCDEAAAQGCQLMVFPEFTLTRGEEPGFCRIWTREEWLKIAIVIPGLEIQAIGQKAKQHRCYICFSSYFQLPDWPGHFMNGSIMLGPSGDVIYVHWKHYFGYPGIGMEYATTAFDVLDEFVDRYGWDAVTPIVRTPIGNLAGYVCSESFFNSEIARVYAFKGAEVLCRSYGGHGWGLWHGRCIHTLQGDCAQNLVWCVASNHGNTNDPDNPLDSPSGSSMIVDPCGNIVAMSKTIREDIVTYTIPIAEFRTEANRYDKFSNPHFTPATYRGGVRTELFIPEYKQHPGQFPPNLLTKYQIEHSGELPPDYKTTRFWYFKHARWELQYHDSGEQ